MIDFIAEHRAIYGVEPICRVLPIAPSTYHAHAARRADPGKLPARAQRDAALKVEIGRVYDENFRVCGVVYGVRDLATARPGRDCGRPLHRGASDADDRLAGCRTGQDGPDHNQQCGGPVSARSRQSAVQGTTPKCPVGVQLSIRRLHLAAS